MRVCRGMNELWTIHDGSRGIDDGKVNFVLIDFLLLGGIARDDMIG